ncbi:hypothetical protein A3J43_02270 [Candidatus Uhrbacteria bacterium RIFCSPHIGHO2_12_FULL_54_23]|uniref:Addiction module antitoxin n=2 Tax=Candidatus Uhriibacteriota TaxID=1752732 RepID=A0A1F7UHC4_9BACT|nr:MAG: hypothetical protein A3J43_02270 [Candidatus Uhrbacteria bacterium RIFCSPHIGHO2_12_FULL_54_23]OGL89662.1 MAG: hypothetical protein A3J36_00840 [Candidatus Uhrbacteria bacterium RIFCSPLOWO2_02_FULL_54_37]
MSVSLPTALKDYARQRSRDGHYGTPSDYVRSLIREDLKRAEQERLERELLKGLRSGKGKAVTPKEWAKLRSQVMARG